MRIRKLLFLLLIMSLLSLLSGCWDSIEINKRAFALGIAVDKASKEGNLQVTYEVALPGKMVTPGGGEGDSGGEGSATWDITKETRTQVQANHTMHENIDKYIDLEHMQLLLFGEEMAKEGIYDDVDFFFRRPQMRRRTKIVYVQGEAKEILKIEPKTTKAPSMFIAEILDTNKRYSHTITRGIDLGELVQNIRDGFDFSLVRVRKVDKEVVVDGAAAFKAPDYKFVTNINEGEVETIEWMMGIVTRGNVEIDDPQKPIYKAAFEIYGGKGELKPIFNGDKVDFELELKVEGDIASMEDTNFLGALEQSYLDAFEKAVEEKMKTELLAAFDKYEKQIKIDIFQLKRKVKNYNIKYYDKNKERLTDILAESNIDVKVDVKVRRIGLTK